MPTSNFEEFARAFRERTGSRLLEFEKTLAKAQNDIEKAVHDARDELRQRPTNPAHSAASAETRTNRHTVAGRPYASAPAAETHGPVKSVLRRH